MNAQWWTTPSAHPPHCYLVVCCVQEKGTVNAQWWTTEVSAVLGTDQFVKVGLRQMSGNTDGAGWAGLGEGQDWARLSYRSTWDGTVVRQGRAQASVRYYR